MFISKTKIDKINLSGRRGSNPRPTAWKAVALPTELLPLILFYFKNLLAFKQLLPKR